MKNKLIVIFVLLLFGCEDIITIRQIDKELKPHYDSFINEGIQRGVDYSRIPIVMKFKDIELAGSSTTLDGKFADVRINRYYFDNYTENQIEVLTFHELGHALINRAHDSSCFSLMSSDLCKYENYKTHRSSMLDELF